MRGDHHPVALVLGQAELGLEHADDELARREIVIEQDHLVQLRPLDPRLGRCAGLGGCDPVRH